MISIPTKWEDFIAAARSVSAEPKTSVRVSLPNGRIARFSINQLLLAETEREALTELGSIVLAAIAYAVNSKNDDLKHTGKVDGDGLASMIAGEPRQVEVGKPVPHVEAAKDGQLIAV